MDEERLTKAERKARRKQDKISARELEAKQDNLKKWLSLVGIIGVMVIVGWGIYQRYVPIPGRAANKPINQVSQADWYLGNKEAVVKIIEYSDFQCPACKLYSPMMAELNQIYKDKIVIVYRHFPLKEIHRQAEVAAQAAEAAGKQGKYWEMNQLLFERQTDWADKPGIKKTLISYAQELGLNQGQFEKDLNSKEVKGLVKADYLSGLSHRLNSTPSFFINGERMVNPQGIEAFQEIIDLKLTEATASGEVGS